MKLSVFKIKLLLLSFQLLIASPHLAAFSGAASTSDTPKADILKSKFVQSVQKVKNKLQDTSKKIAHKLGIKNFDSKLDAPFELGDKAIIRTAKILDKSLEILDDESFWPWIGCGVGAAAGGALGALVGGAITAGLSVSTLGVGVPAATAIGAAISAGGFGLGSAVGPAVTILICRASRLARNKLFEEQADAEKQLAENKKAGVDSAAQSDRTLDDIVLGLQGSISAGSDGKQADVTDALEKHNVHGRLQIDHEKLASLSSHENSKSDTLIVYRSNKTLYFNIHGSGQTINLPSLTDIPFYYSSGICPTMEILGGFFVKADDEKLALRDMTTIIRQMFDPKTLKLNIKITGDMPANAGSLVVFFQIDKKIYTQIIDNKSSAVITPKDLENAYLVIDLEKDPMPIDHAMLEQSKQDTQKIVKKLQKQEISSSESSDLAK